eukprot:m.30610 g.30610  ORF g.30610 m.30610 type:complete len:825 (+) comp4729_c0_seq1:3-2477(+)
MMAPRSMSLAVYAVVVMAAVHVQASFAAVEVYVASIGMTCSDTGPGTESDPLCTLNKAADRVAGSAGTVILRGGRHQLNTTLQLTAQHKGTTWRAMAGERPVVSGGVQLPHTAWRVSADNKPWGDTRTPGLSVWSTPIPQSAAMARQIYVNGIRAYRTSGNASILFQTMTPLTRSPNGTYGPVGPGYSVTSSVAKTWRNPSDLEFVYARQVRPWTAPRCGITGIAPDGLSIGVEPVCFSLLPAPSGTSKVRWWLSGLPDTIENAYELLNTSGTFYIDRVALILYYILRPGEVLTDPSTEVIAPVLESLVLATDSDGVSLSDIDFEHTTWGGPDTRDGYVPTQAGWHTASASPSNRAHYQNDGIQAVDAPIRVPPHDNTTLHPTATTTRGVKAHSDVLLMNAGLESPNFLVSESGKYFAIMQSNGQFCVRQGQGPTDPHAHVIVWCSAEIPTPGASYTAVIQGDANFCIHDNVTNVWCSSGVSLPSAEYYVRLMDDGSLCTHQGHYPASSKVVWCAPISDPTAVQQPIPGGVRFNHSNAVTITRCAFRHMGGAGLDLYGGCQHGLVQGCLAVDISGTAIQVGGTNPCPSCPKCAVCPEAITDAADFNVTVTDTAVVNATQEFGGCLGVWGGYMRQFRFTHNDVCKLQYGGISLGWGWAISPTHTYQGDNEISCNQISQFLRTFQDSGGTYTLGPHPASSVHHNWVHHAGSGVEPGPDGTPTGGVHGGAYYPDDGSAFWHIYDNVASDVNLWLFAWNPNDQYNLTVYDNYADTTSYEMNAKNSTFLNNTYVPRGTPWPSTAQQIMASAGVRASNAHPDYSPNLCAL